MKTYCRTHVLFLIVITFVTLLTAAGDPMVLHYNTRYKTGRDIDIVLSGTVDVVIDWGDNTYDTITRGTYVPHTFPTDGEYTVKITGTLTSFRGSAAQYASRLDSVSSWGDLGLTDLSRAFRYASNLQSLPDTLPPGVTRMDEMLNGASRFDGDLSGWDVSGVTHMDSLLVNVGLSKENYDALLTSWSQQSLQPGMELSAPLCSYSAVEARQKIIDDFGWTITDFGEYREPMTIHLTTGNSIYTNKVSLPLNGTGRVLIKWGDGSTRLLTRNESNSFIDHEYRNDSNYTITVMGELTRYGTKQQNRYETVIDSISSWGDLGLTSLAYAFYQGGSIESLPEKLPETVTDISGMFSECDTIIPDLRGWDVSRVKNMDSLFLKVYTFTGDVSNWDVSSVESMKGMFYADSLFNGDLSNWNVGNVTDMSYMFVGAKSFNGDLSKWDVSSVKNFSDMFMRCYSFNNDISGWNVSSAENMNSMFYYATKFNQDISGWNVGNVTKMNRMFCADSAFNQDISGWDVSSVTTMNTMFCNATSFNQPIGSWNVSAVKDMWGMFSGADQFNQDLNNWDVSSVTNMFLMFQDAKLFNSDLNNWNTSSVTRIDEMFRNAESFNGDISTWDLSGVTKLKGMFSGATSFNQSINNWNVGNVQNTDSLFCDAVSFNQDLNGWNLSSDTSMESMFQNAVQFNGAVDQWDVKSVTSMLSMFKGASSFNQDLNSWDISNVRTVSSMFEDASAFNGDIGNWDFSGVYSVMSMFENATSFNRDISGWVVSKTTFMWDTFKGAVSFDQNLGSWDISNIASMRGMFEGVTLSTKNYNATLKGWAQQELRDSIIFDAGNSLYTAGDAEAARQKIIDDFGWEINDGGVTDDIAITPAGIKSSADALPVIAPNPVSVSADYVEIVIPKSLRGTVAIFDNAGNLMDSYDFESEELNSFRWDLNNRSGKRVAPGTYVALFTLENFEGTVEQSKVMLGVYR